MKLSPFYYPCIVIAQHVPRTMSTYLINDSGGWTVMLNCYDGAASDDVNIDYNFNMFNVE